jgi:hypothetical protein
VRLVRQADLQGVRRRRAALPPVLGTEFVLVNLCDNQRYAAFAGTASVSHPLLLSGLARGPFSWTDSTPCVRVNRPRIGTVEEMRRKREENDSVQ